MYDVALKLGVAVVKAACGIWLQNPLAEDAATTVVDIVQEKVTGRRDQRRLERRFAEIEESIAERVLGYLDHEFRGMPDNEREAAVLAVADSFERAGLTDRVLFEQDLDPLYLERYVRRKHPHATRYLSDQGTSLYDRVLPEACAYVLATLTTLPRFQAGTLTELLRRESLVLEHLEEVLDRLPEPVAGGAEDPEAAFATAYRRKAAERWDVLELFGTDAHTRRYPLTLAYLSLRVSQDEQEERFRSGLLYENGEQRVERVLAAHPRTFLRGPAGSGKTTLMRWVGVRASRGDFPEEMASWNGLVPFLVPLRQYVDRALPEPEEFVRHTGRHLADQAPRGWVARVLAEGRAVVLVDGVDELPQGQREAARRWLRDLLSDFPDCRYVVTTRPGAASETWLDADGFATAELQPLRDEDVRAFIRHWHGAVRSETADEAERELLSRYEEELTRKVTAQRHLRAIAATPLLCALLCALYRDQHTALPRDRMEVYEAALAMLLKDRDQQRGIVGGVDLSRKELVLLLQELARWLVVNGKSDAPAGTARRRVGRILASMHRVEEPEEEVYTHLVVRSGLLHTPAVDRVSFLHRTFEEYLAAKALVEEDSFPFLVANAHDDQWHEVVVMAAGHATPAQREELIRGLLERSGQVRRHRDRLLLVAFACLETSPQLSGALREEIRTRVREILPPRTKAHVHALSLVGEFALPLLAEHPPTNAREAERVVEVAAAVGGPQAVPTIERALAFPTRRVFAAAQRAWWKDQGEDLARVFLPVAAERYVDHYLPVPADRVDLHLRYMPDNPRVCLEGRDGDEIQDATKLPHTTRLQLRNRDYHAWHGIDLGPVGELPHLTEFEIYGNAFTESVAPLGDTHVQKVSLSHPDQTRDLHLLRDFARLSDLEFTGTLPPLPLEEVCPPPLEALTYRSVRMADLSSLAEVPDSLRRLWIVFCHGLRSLAGLEGHRETLTRLTYLVLDEHSTMDLAILRGFERLSLLRLDLRVASANARWISRIPRLRSLGLVFSRSDRDASVPSWIRELPHLEELGLFGSGPFDLRPLAGARDLTVGVPSGRRVTGAELLGEGCRVRRGFRGSPFLW
ncbi:NACHT domain-containing protein [Nocardiopsis sp. FR6]|uniref:NACHT domain-containing protein n=1 Tax=Nocardiopsis sp. FR6 TaxID=2605986 RepID=UPI0013591AA8|nr:NACHT domain-containing protein [Nocardiopsis sp. FR6]